MRVYNILVVYSMVFFSITLKAQDNKLSIDKILLEYSKNYKSHIEYVVDSFFMNNISLEKEKMDLIVIPKLYIDTTQGFKKIRVNLYPKISINKEKKIFKVLFFRKRIYQGSLIYKKDNYKFCLGNDLNSKECSHYNINFGIAYKSLKKVIKKKPELIFTVDKIDDGWWFIKNNQIFVCTYCGDILECNDYIQSYSLDEMVEILRYGMHKPKEIQMNDFKRK